MPSERGAKAMRVRTVARMAGIAVLAGLGVAGSVLAADEPTPEDRAERPAELPPSPKDPPERVPPERESPAPPKRPFVPSKKLGVESPVSLPSDI
jgi:hypothetical protein